MRKKINGHICDTERSTFVVEFPAEHLSGRTYMEPRLRFYVTKRDKICFGVTYASGEYCPVIMPSEQCRRHIKDIAIDRRWDAEKIARLNDRMMELGIKY